jgi:hypothetical protein
MDTPQELEMASGGGGKGGKKKKKKQILFSTGSLRQY